MSVRTQPAQGFCISVLARQRSCRVFHVERLSGSESSGATSAQSHIVRLKQALLECLREWIRRLQAKGT